MSSLIKLDGTPFMTRPDGTLILNVMLTFKPGRDDAQIERIKAAPKRGIASVVLQMMREGALSVDGNADTEEEVDLSGLAQDL